MNSSAINPETKQGILEIIKKNQEVIKSLRLNNMALGALLPPEPGAAGQIEYIISPKTGKKLYCKKDKLIRKNRMRVLRGGRNG